MKLFKVRVEFETVMCAKSLEEAEREAEYVIKNEDDAPANFIDVQEITLEGDLPQGWNSECFPFNDNRNLMIGEILEQKS